MLRTERIFHRPLVFLSEYSALLVFIWMTVPPVPVLRLLLFVCFRVFELHFGILRTIPRIGTVFVVIPVVVVLVVPIVDSDLNTGALRLRGQDCYWRGKSCS